MTWKQPDIDVQIETGDLEIGAVEMKNATTDDRAKVAASGSVAEGDVVIGVQAPVLGATTGAAVVTDANGTLQQYLRGLVKLFVAEDFATQTTLAALLAAVNDYPTIATPTVLSVSGTSAATGAAVSAGKYILTADIDICWTTAASPTAVWQTSKFLPAGVPMPVTLPAEKVAAITGGGAGKLYISAVS